MSGCGERVRDQAEDKEAEKNASKAIARGENMYKKNKAEVMEDE